MEIQRVGATPPVPLGGDAGVKMIDGVEIRGTPTFLGWIGGNNPAGQLAQGALKSARDEKGNWIFWLEGKGTNYLLKNDKGALITNQSDAEERAREMIKWGEASDLRRLGCEFNDNGDYFYTYIDEFVARGDTNILVVIPHENFRVRAEKYAESTPPESKRCLVNVEIAVMDSSKYNPGDTVIYQGRKFTVIPYGRN